MNQTILVFSDLHAPYNHPDALDFLAAIKRRYKPDLVVSCGDEVDFSAMSFHERDPDMDSPIAELTKARAIMTRLFKLFPRMIHLTSNHGSLPYRKAKAAGIPSSLIHDYRTIYNAPRGHKWLPELRLAVNGLDILFTHYKGEALEAAKAEGCCVVQGHSHTKSYIQYFGRQQNLKWAMQLGWLGNDSAPAFQYNKLHAKRPLLTVGIIHNGIPRLIPMHCGPDGHWLRSI
jgi:predicted phosphodiesterase